MKTLNTDSAALHAPNPSSADTPTFLAGIFTRCDNFWKVAGGISPSSLRRTIAQLVAFTLLGSPLAAFADSSAAKLLVSATVLKHASLRVLTQPGSVQVTATDIARGYVDVSSPAQVAVQSNTPSGYLLMFETQGEFLRQTLVKGLGTEVQLGASGGGVAQRSTGRGMIKTVHELEFRFLLSESARQGFYAWPLRLSVTPL